MFLVRHLCPHLLACTTPIFLVVATIVLVGMVSGWSLVGDGHVDSQSQYHQLKRVM